jgi:hypothetical protein
MAWCCNLPKVILQFGHTKIVISRIHLQQSLVTPVPGALTREYRPAKDQNLHKRYNTDCNNIQPQTNTEEIKKKSHSSKQV